MVGNRGPVVEGHRSLTTCFTNLPTITARHITAPHFPQTFRLKPRFWSPVLSQVPNELGPKSIRYERKCSLDIVFVGHRGGGGYKRRCQELQNFKIVPYPKLEKSKTHTANVRAASEDSMDASVRVRVRVRRGNSSTVSTRDPNMQAAMQMLWRRMQGTQANGVQW